MEIDMTRYQGDDLINIMTVEIKPKEEGEELPEIVAVDVKVGCLVLHYDNPTNPFSIDILREQSIKLSTVNHCYACVWYKDTVKGEEKILKKTCEGTLTLDTKPEVIGNGRCQC